jgi:D-serine deaminase-like pyridoxal phosphate-dependent protein
MADPSTPYLRIDTARLKANVEGTARAAAAAGVALRPHAKTHKCVEIARLQLDAGAVGLTVATLGEAEVFVDHGVQDVLVAYPLWLDDDGARRLVGLAERASLTIGVDSVQAVANTARRVPGLKVLVELDSGQHRSGVAPDDAGALAAAAAEAGLDVRGAFTFPGHGYSPGGRASAARDEAAALAAAAESFRAHGLEPDVLSGGSTPTLSSTLETVSMSSSDGSATEQRPGVYCFGDAQQWELGAMDADDLALACHATVVSHAGGRVVLDAGSKALGADRASYSTGSGRLLDHPEARLVQLSEHHCVVEWRGGALPLLGSRLRVVPNHVCVAVNLADVLWADLDGRLEPWSVAARGRNS